MNSNEKPRCFGRRRLWRIPFVIAAIVLIKSAVVMLLWNCLIPDLFHVGTITYLQAVELSVLVRLLVGFGGHRFGGHFGHGPRWLKHHWSNLSPEDREKLRDEIRKRTEGEGT